MGIGSQRGRLDDRPCRLLSARTYGPRPCLGEAWNPSMSGLEQTSSFPLLSSMLPFCPAQHTVGNHQGLGPRPSLATKPW